MATRTRMRRSLLLTFLLLCLPACASSRVVVGGAPDAGVPPDAAAPEDSAVPLDMLASDAGPVPSGVCADAAAAAPLGVLAVRMDGDTLLGLGAGATQRRLHRVFDGVAIRGDVAATRLLATAERIAGVASAELDCARPSCPRVTEVFIVTAAGVRSAMAERPAGFRDPGIIGLTGDGLLSLRLVRDDRTFESFTRLIDLNAGAILGDLTCCTTLAGSGEPDAGGWRPATLADPEDVRTRAGFVRFVAGAVETRDLGLEGALAWRDAWVSWDAAGVHIDRVSGRRSVRFRRDVEGRLRTPRLYQEPGVDTGLLELWAEGTLHGVVDLEAERSVLLGAPLVSSWETSVETRVDFGLWLVAASGAPRRTVNLASGEVRDHALTEGFAPLEAQYCTPGPSLLPGGDFGLVLRGPERTGAYVLDFLGEAPPRPVGFRLRDVAFGAVQPAGPHLAVIATDGRMTFCPSVEPSDEPPAEGELVGDSFQLLGPDDAQLLREGEGLFGYLDRAGRCALLGDGPRPEELTLLDLTNQERLTFPSGGGWQALDTLPLFIF
ncbi:MAG: hypothetical protein AAF447_12140 [Myxococcota bacterium]